LAEGAAVRLRMSYVLTTPGGLPEVIASKYQRRYHGVQISDSGSTAQNLEWLRRGELDVAFVLSPLEVRHQPKMDRDCHPGAHGRGTERAPP
jgi:hypothetical protein